MKPQAYPIEDPQHSGIEADLEATINALFRRCPTLCGFSVRDAAHLARDGLAHCHANRLIVTDVSDYPWSGPQAPANLCFAIMAALAELVDACPGACELLRERSFARVIH